MVSHPRPSNALCPPVAVDTVPAWSDLLLQAMRAVVEHSRKAETGSTDAAAAPADFDPENAPLLISIEDPAMKANSSAVMVLSQQLDLVRMCSEVASELRNLPQKAL